MDVHSFGKQSEVIQNHYIVQYIGGKYHSFYTFDYMPKKEFIKAPLRTYSWKLEWSQVQWLWGEIFWFCLQPITCLQPQDNEFHCQACYVSICENCNTSLGVMWRIVSTCDEGENSCACSHHKLTNRSSTQKVKRVLYKHSDPPSEYVSVCMYRMLLNVCKWQAETRWWSRIPPTSSMHIMRWITVAPIPWAFIRCTRNNPPRHFNI